MRRRAYLFLAVAVCVLPWWLAHAGADPEPPSRGPAASGSPDHDHDLVMLHRQVDFQNRELQRLRDRDRELRRTLQQVLASLKAKPRQTSDDALVALIDRTLTAQAPGDAAPSAHGSNHPAATGNVAPGFRPVSGVNPPAATAPAVTPGSPAPPPAAQPVGPQASPSDFHVPGFAFTKVALQPAGQGAACTGRVTNQSLRDEVVTARFRLTTYDEQGREIERVSFFVAFAQSDETRAFSVPIKHLPPTGRFKIERVYEE